MFRAQAQSALDSIIGIRQEIVDRHLVLKGTFDEEIKRLEAVRDEATQKLGKLDAVKAFEAAKTEADGYAARLKADADKAMQSASAALATANTKMEAALTKEKSVADREAQALALMEEYHKKADAFDADVAEREAKLATREAAFSAAQAKFAADSAAITAKQQDVLRQLDAAKALAQNIA